MIRTPLYYLSAFISGMAVMAVEMSFSRLLAPYFGNSLFVWTNVIGLVMLALALGYYLGGILADNHPKPGLYFHLIFWTGLWIVLLPFVSGPLFQVMLFSFPDLAGMVRYGSFIAVFILLVAPMIFLGMNVPFTVKLVTDSFEKVGRYSGRVSLASTGGSLIGTFLPAFFLIPLIGTSATIIVMGVLLMLIACVGSKRWWQVLLVILAALALWAAPPVFAHSWMIDSEDSPYGYVFVTEDGEGIRRLHVDSMIGSQSVYDPSTPLSDHYYSYFGVLPALIDAPESILILGHAGGSFTRIFNSYYPELSITGVELDPLVTEMGMRYMGLDEADVEIVHGDARSFLHTTEDAPDLILVDAYHSANIPAHLATQEFFTLADGVLTEGGVLALNVAADESEFLTAMENTLSSVFEEVFAVPVPGSFNTLLVASHEPHVWKSVPSALQNHLEYVQSNRRFVNYDETALVFTDEHATQVELLTEAMLLDLLSGY